MSSGDTAATHDSDDTPDQITYQFTIDGDLWTEWKRSVPRDVALHEEIRTLIRSATYDEKDITEQYRLSAIRIRRHAIRLNQEIAKRDDAENMTDDINAIVQLINEVI